MEITNTCKSLTTAEQMKDQTKMIMQPYANWEEYLTPAPLSIAILGELVFISSQTDFFINKNPPKEGYKHIKYPESFQACLMQVCNAGWGAFNEAHKNMDQIRLHTMAVPDYMKTTVKILFQGDEETVKALLPQQLDNILNIADECTNLADKTEKQFTNAILIIQELLEACKNSEHVYKEDLVDVQRKIEENKMREQTSIQAKERMEKAMKTMEKKMEEAQENFNKALDSMPSGWDMIGMDFVGGIVNGITSVMNGMAAVAVKKAEDTVGTGNQTKDSGVDACDKIGIFCKSAEIVSCIESMLQFVKENSIDWKSLYDQKKKETKTDFMEKQFTRISSDLKKNPDCEPRKLALQLCEEGINICKELAKYAPDEKCEETITKELIQRMRELSESAKCFDSKSKSSTNSPSMAPQPPMMAKQGSTDLRHSERAAQNARFRIEQTKAELAKAREMYEKSVEKMEENQKELTEILISLRNCEVKEIDFKTTIKMLMKGMDAMGRVKEQWEKMVRFFQMVSSIVKVSLNTTLKDFVSTSETTQKLSYNGKLFSKDLLYKQAFQASNIASLVHMISETYTQVSDKYLMDRVSSLGKLIAMDKSKPEFEQERLKLQNTCDDAQKEILNLVVKNKKDFERKTDSRLEKIDKELLAILPAAAPEEVKRIQAAVKSGFTEDELADY